MAKVLSCLNELTNKLSILSSVTIGRKSIKTRKGKRASILQPGYHSPIYFIQSTDQKFTWQPSFAFHSPVELFQGQLPFACCIPSCWKEDPLTKHGLKVDPSCLRAGPPWGLPMNGCSR